ncbi:MAG TPA: hypothetical protein VII38_10730 [Polyangia bacterium]
MFASSKLRLALLGCLLALVGCDHHRLDLSLALARDSCTIPVPAGGSILYQVTSGAAPDGGDRSFCGGCLPVTTALDSTDQILAFLRGSAPACAGVAPDSTLRVALTAFSAASCPDVAGPARLFCSESPPIALPDGRSDAVVSVVLTCDPACSGGCTPSSCAALGKDCGMLSDGCGGMLDCGGCAPPEQCGGHAGGGAPNVCSK